MGLFCAFAGPTYALAFVDRQDGRSGDPILPERNGPKTIYIDAPEGRNVADKFRYLVTKPLYTNAKQEEERA